MGVLSTALANLGAVSVEGITSYSLDETPDSPGRAQLPALVILPELARESPGLEPNTFAAGEGRLVAQVVHVLLYAPVAGGRGQRGTLPGLVAAVDGYVTALAVDPTLDGALAVPLRCGVRIGVVAYGGIEYHAATFNHTWMLHLA